MTIKVRVVLGTMGPSWGHGFYPEIDFLYSWRANARGMHYTLQGWCDLLVMDRDENHTLVSMELFAGSKNWQVQDDLQAPPAEPGQVFVQEDIDDGQVQAYFTDSGYTIFYARLEAEESEPPVQHVTIAEEVVLDIDRSGTLVGVWLLDLPPEIAALRGV